MPTYADAYTPLTLLSHTLFSLPLSSSTALPAGRLALSSDARSCFLDPRSCSLAESAGGGGDADVASALRALKTQGGGAIDTRSCSLVAGAASGGGGRDADVASALRMAFACVPAGLAGWFLENGSDASCETRIR
jgi:hypothetical protein